MVCQSLMNILPKKIFPHMRKRFEKFPPIIWVKIVKICVNLGKICRNLHNFQLKVSKLALRIKRRYHAHQVNWCLILRIEFDPEEFSFQDPSSF